MNINYKKLTQLFVGMAASGIVAAQSGGYSSSIEEIKIDASTTIEEPSDSKEMEAVLLTTQFKSAGRGSLYKIDLSSECEIRRFTRGVSENQKNNHSQLGASIVVWAEIDGQVIPISPNEDPDETGRLPLCAQLEWDEASNPNRDDLNVAAGYSWMASNIPRGKHQLELKARFYAFSITKENAGGGVMARVGKRMLTVNQFK